MPFPYPTKVIAHLTDGGDSEFIFRRRGQALVIQRREGNRTWARQIAAQSCRGGPEGEASPRIQALLKQGWTHVQPRGVFRIRRMPESRQAT